MLETSQDFLFIVLGFCVLWLTIFISWILYYIIKIFKNTNKAVSEVQKTIEKVDEFIENFKSRIEKSASGFMVLGELAKQGINFMERRKDREDESVDIPEPKKRKRVIKRKK